MFSSQEQTKDIENLHFMHHLEIIIRKSVPHISDKSNHIGTINHKHVVPVQHDNTPLHVNAVIKSVQLYKPHVCDPVCG